MILDRLRIREDSENHYIEYSLVGKEYSDSGRQQPCPHGDLAIHGGTPSMEEVTVKCRGNTCPMGWNFMKDTGCS